MSDLNNNTTASTSHSKSNNKKNKNKNATNDTKEKIKHSTTTDAENIDSSDIDNNDEQNTNNKNNENELIKQLVSENEKNLRSLADAKNAERRANEAVIASELNCKVEIMRSLIEVIDNLDRAAAIEDKSSKNYADGITMVHQNLNEKLATFGLEKITDLKKFDVLLHMPVGTETKKGFKHDEITEVLQDGYKIGDTVIRHAMVKVNT